mgnify:CR=1 FL=1
MYDIEHMYVCTTYDIEGLRNKGKRICKARKVIEKSEKRKESLRSEFLVIIN